MTPRKLAASKRKGRSAALSFQSYDFLMPVLASGPGVTWRACDLFNCAL